MHLNGVSSLSCSDPTLRLLFAADGEWLNLDNADPLHGWDVAAVYASGKRHGVDSTDIYGCLFFHVKDEFEEFARRIKRFHADIYMTQFDARILSEMIPEGIIKAFGPTCFDRVETSNMADYIGPAEVIDNWGPLLNRRNKHVTLLVYFMNWHLQQPGGQLDSEKGAKKIFDTIMSQTALALVSTFAISVLRSAKHQVQNIDLNAIVMKKMMSPYSPELLRILANVNIFYDNSGPFDQFLRGKNAEKKAGSHGLRLRSKNNIHTRVWGVRYDTCKIPPSFTWAVAYTYR